MYLSHDGDVSRGVGSTSYMYMMGRKKGIVPFTRCGGSAYLAWRVSKSFDRFWFLEKSTEIFELVIFSQIWYKQH